MAIFVYFTPDELPATRSLVKICTVVIDVLRASTTIAVALKNGCKEILPVETVDEAFTLAGKFERQYVLLCGERKGHKLADFDLGNSPREYSKRTVENKTIILTTTNGTRALLKAKKTKDCFILSLVNLSAVRKKCLEHAANIHIICAGREGDYSLEDTFCAGSFIKELQVYHSGLLMPGNQQAVHAVEVAEKYNDSYLDVLQQSEHGKYLKSIGYETDLIFCARRNAIPIVPKYKNGNIKCERKSEHQT
jgi:2-phosphosulfolactate phosphatase